MLQWYLLEVKHTRTTVHPDISKSSLYQSNIILIFDIKENEYINKYT